MQDYCIVVFWSEQDEAYIADIPDLKYCSAHGKTPAEAVRQVQIAKKAWLQSAREHGKRVPKPKFRPAIYQTA